VRRFSRAVVFGGAGFLGSHLCDALLAAGSAVVCIDNFCTGDPGNVEHLMGRADFDLIDHDVTRPLGRWPELDGTDVVFHLASAASPKAYSRLPLETLRAGSFGTENGLELAERHGARFVLASTSEVYGDPLVHPQVEEYVGHVNPIGPRSVYDEGKRYAEAITEAYRRSRGSDTAIARIFNSYGPRMRPDDGRMIPAFITQALAGEPLTISGSGRQTRSVCHVSDTVAGLLALARSTESGPINLGNPRELTVLDTARLIAELVGSDVVFEYGPAPADDPQRRCPDISRAATRLGWVPRVAVREGLARTVEWFADRRIAAGMPLEPGAGPAPDDLGILAERPLTPKAG
jgi:dTDP-glucose 4,6-dehydratase